MMQYAKFLCNRVLRRKANFYLIIASILALSAVLIVNITMQDTVYDNLKNQMQALEKEESEFSKTQIRKYEALLAHYDKKEWSSFYEKYQLMLEENIQQNEEMMNTADHPAMQDDYMNFIRKDLAYITYLKDHNLAYTDIDYPTIGLSFINYVSGIISPILILLCCIFTFTQVFTMDYAKSIDISNLLPIGRRKAFLAKLIVGMVISSLIFILILGITFFLASLLHFDTGLAYPIMIQDAVTNSWMAVPLSSYVKEWLLLGLLFYAGTCAFTYLLSLFIKEEGPLFLTSLCIILGIAYLPIFIPEMGKIAHYLPTTYLNFVHVASGELALQYSNFDISFTMGVQVLSLVILVIFILCFLIKCASSMRLKAKKR